MKIYVASSWRNNFQSEVVRILRNKHYLVYDFKGPGDGWGLNGHGPGVFSWSEIDNDWRLWIYNIPTYLKALQTPRAKEAFYRDMNALKIADICIMVMPCGPSASMKMGWACGNGKPTYVYIPEMREPDLMVKMANLVTNNFSDIIKEIENAS